MLPADMWLRGVRLKVPVCASALLLTVLGPSSRAQPHPPPRSLHNSPHPAYPDHKHCPNVLSIFIGFLISWTGGVTARLGVPVPLRYGTVLHAQLSYTLQRTIELAHAGQ